MVDVIKIHMAIWHREEINILLKILQSTAKPVSFQEYGDWICYHGNLTRYCHLISNDIIDRKWTGRESV